MARDIENVRAALQDVDGALGSGKYVAGYIAYEAGAAFEPGTPDVLLDRTAPLVWFGVYNAPSVVATESVDVALARCSDDLGVRIRVGPYQLDPATYFDRISRIKQAIEDGDVYQINLTGAIPFTLSSDPIALYGALRARQSVAYGAVVRTGEADILSFSPELFFRIDIGKEGRWITARPMKGTAPRGADTASDDKLAAALRQDAKGRAENLMIVDLLRNDLAQVSEVGSVEVPRLFEDERYATVTQMTSTVRARLRSDAGLASIFGSIFPCGSVTGAPKLRAMKTIRELELGPRGVYCGSVGYASPDGSAAFSVAIRTAIVRNGRGRYDVGSGIVWDSVASDELAECMLKATVLTDLARDGQTDSA